jgi:hypothetical protein
MKPKRAVFWAVGVLIVVVALCVDALLFLPYFVKIGKHRPQKLKCELNLKQIVLCLRQWMIDHDNQHPFNVSTNSGGTRELVLADAEGFDLNAYWHFLVMSNELNSTKTVVCPQDRSKVTANQFCRAQTRERHRPCKRKLEFSRPIQRCVGALSRRW